MRKVEERLGSERLAAMLRIQSTALSAVHGFMSSEGFVQLMPVILSPITDPLCHSVYDAGISYAGQKLSLTKSMILHKQVAVSSPHLPRIYIVSPNIRLEKESTADTGRHLIEFSQVDMEMRDTGRDEFMGLMERLLCHIIEQVRLERKDDLKLLGRTLETPRMPFKRFESKEECAKYGEDFERELSLVAEEPFWIMDHEREFYDREEPFSKGHYRNYDLVYPGGFGEALSGGERDWEYEVLSRKIAERRQKEEMFAPYIELAKRGRLVPSTGGGFGVERLVRWLSGAGSIAEVTPFAKVPGDRFVI